MRSSRVLGVRTAGAAASCARASPAIQSQELEVDAGVPGRGAAGGRARRPRAPRLPDLDRTDLEFVTIDPAGAMDLDQAMHLERDGDGYVVHYAIADVMAFIDAG